MNVNAKELTSGAVFIVIGGFFAGNALMNLRIGSALAMGPGFFPVILGGILMALGVAIAVSGRHKPREEPTPMPWRGLFFVILSIVSFGLFARSLGFAPALFISVFLASMSSGLVSVRACLVVAAVLTVFCTLVFVEALGLPYPILGRWLSF